MINKSLLQRMPSRWTKNHLGNWYKEKPFLDKNGKWKGDITTKEELRKLYIEDNLSIRKIGKILGISYRTVKRRLAMHNIPTRNYRDSLKFRKLKGIPHPTARKPLTKEAEELFKSGLPISHISRKTRFSCYVIRRCLKEKGYKTNKNIMNSIRRSEARFSEELGHIVRSKWEEKICKILRSNSIEYKYEPIKLRLGTSEYTPDIMVKNFLVEIKGLRADRDDGLNKFLEANFLYPRFTFLLIGRNNEIKNVAFDKKFSIFKTREIDKKESRRFLDEITKN